MDDLIGLTMDGSSVKTQGKPTNFLIDYDFDGIDASSSSVAPGIPSLPAASSTPGTTASPQNIVNAKDAAYGWDMCLKESLDMVKFPRGPVFDGPFKEFEQVWKDKQNNTHNISTCSVSLSLSSIPLFLPVQFLTHLFVFWGKPNYLPQILSLNRQMSIIVNQFWQSTLSFAPRVRRMSTSSSFRASTTRASRSTISRIYWS